MKRYIYILILSLTFLSYILYNENSYKAQNEKSDPFSEIYEGATITFEDGFLWTAQCINSDNFQDDEAECILTNEEFEGSRQLKIEVVGKADDGNYKVPKIKFDVDRLVGINNVSRIKSVSLDITASANGTFTADNGEEILVPGNCMGEIDANSGEECAVWTTLAGFEFAEWEHTSIRKHIVGNILLPKSRYIDGEKECTIVFMRWPIPNSADVYIDNITFYDDDGEPIPLVYDPANPPAETSEIEISASEENETSEEKGSDN